MHSRSTTALKPGLVQSLPSEAEEKGKPEAQQPEQPELPEAGCTRPDFATQPPSRSKGTDPTDPCMCRGVSGGLTVPPSEAES